MKTSQPTSTILKINNKIIHNVAAPMVGGSELAYRMFLRKKGNMHLCYSPMIPANMYISPTKNRPNSYYLTSCKEDRPLIVQLAGSNSSTLLQACKQIIHSNKDVGIDGFDINLGCPQESAQREGYGAFLCEKDEANNWKNIIEIIHTLSEYVGTLQEKVSVSCKIRLQSSTAQTIKLCKYLQDSGCDFIAIHGRKISQKEHHIESCDWDAIRKIKNSGIRIPIIANGNCWLPEDITKMKQITTCDSIMCGSVLLENPYFFSTCKNVGNCTYNHTNNEVEKEGDIIAADDPYVEYFRCDASSNNREIKHKIVTLISNSGLDNSILDEIESLIQKDGLETSILWKRRMDLSREYLSYVKKYDPTTPADYIRKHIRRFLRPVLMLKDYIKWWWINGAEKSDTRNNKRKRYVPTYAEILWDTINSNSMKSYLQFEKLLDVIEYYLRWKYNNDSNNKISNFACNGENNDDKAIINYHMSLLKENDDLLTLKQIKHLKPNRTTT